jgi:hypothetical protein
MKWIKNLNGLYNFIGYVVLFAPDKFPKEDYLKPEEQMTLDKAMAELHKGLEFVEVEVVGADKKTELRNML